MSVHAGCPSRGTRTIDPTSYEDSDIRGSGLDGFRLRAGVYRVQRLGIVD